MPNRPSQVSVVPVLVPGVGSRVVCERTGRTRRFIGGCQASFSLRKEGIDGFSSIHGVVSLKSGLGGSVSCQPTSGEGEVDKKKDHFPTVFIPHFWIDADEFESPWQMGTPLFSPRKELERSVA
jgi:hypothetical protein